MLVAYLLAEEVLALEDLVPVLDRVRSGASDLEGALVHAGALDSQSVAQLRAQAERRFDQLQSVGAPASLDGWIDAARGYDPADGEADTLYDVVPHPGSKRAGDRLGAAADADGSDPVDPGWDDHLGPTRPNLPASDRPRGSPPPATRPPERPAPGGEIEVSVARHGGPLSPSGRTPGERYRLMRELGRGGMGRILEARDVEIGREVAVKVLLPGLEEAGLAIRRFWTEVQATGQLEHPGIIPVHDVGRLGSGELFYVMKKLTGRTLAEILASLRRGDAPTREEFTRVRLLTIFQQIAYAVAFAHAHGVIHRDIKPGNIMVGQYGEAILIDWGLAKLAGVDDPASEGQMKSVSVLPRSSAETASGTITGTPQYLSPEAAEGDPSVIDSRSDVYGLGAVLYEVLTYAPAYEDLGFVPTIMSVREGEVVSPRRKKPSAQIPEELDELCMSAMARDPAVRPSAKALADDVGRILEGARERERRQREARERVREGRAAADRWKLLKLELQQAESEAKRLRKEVPAYGSIADKRGIWALEDRVRMLRTEAIGAFEEAEAGFLRALGEVADDREARRALASLYYARFTEAERARDQEGQRYYRQLVLRYDDGAWAQTIKGDGSLQVTGDVQTLQVRLAQWVLRDRVLTPSDSRDLGSVPVARFELPMGSYIMSFGPEGAPPQRRPVRIGRAEDVRVHLRYRTAEEVGENFVLVPEGPAILGGDSVAHGGLERRVVEVDEFCIARFPVTCGEYLEFLDDLARDSLERARRHVPRARAQEGHYWWWDESTGRFRFPEVTPGGHRWTADLPVNGVSARDASAYVEWRREQTGERVRLPREVEWEKAARGVDGRFFPWGDEFDPVFCKMKDSREAHPEPEPVGAFPIDCSPYGARDMAGGIREICWTELEGEFAPVMRGGCWSDTGLFCRLAFRHVTQSDFVNTGLGFRLAKDLD